jgi:hypothetical protein
MPGPSILSGPKSQARKRRRTSVLSLSRFHRVTSTSGTTIAFISPTLHWILSVLNAQIGRVHHGDSPQNRCLPLLGALPRVDAQSIAENGCGRNPKMIPCGVPPSEGPFSLSISPGSQSLVSFFVGAISDSYRAVRTYRFRPNKPIIVLQSPLITCELSVEPHRCSYQYTSA